MLVTLIIMDGWGLNPRKDYNAIALADTPFFDYIWNNWPSAVLEASGTAVGLPVGQMGNSEVGHMNLGAGRIVPQDLTYINQLIETGEFDENPALNEAIDHALQNNTSLHLIGLLSDGGVHSHQEHLYALLRLAKRKGLERVYIHALLDGRDTPPRSGAGYLEQLEAQIKRIGCGQIATIAGRYYSMDRDKRWERTKLGYDAIVYGQGKTATSAAEAIQASYAEDVSDEFVIPVVLVDQNGQPVATINDGDAVIFFNFRADRARQLTQALIEPDFSGFERPGGMRRNLKMVTFMHYYDNQTPPFAFSVPEPTNGLAETLSKYGKKQFHCAETEKYAHVTYFFNGGREEPFAGEDRVLVPSPKVATYDLQPEMSARGITEAVVKAIKSGQYDFVLVNFANPDMVGHTGFLDKAMIAVETVDDCVRQVVEATVSMGGAALVTADHGNSDQMLDYDTGKPHTAHTTNLVPFVYVAQQKPDWRLANGVLGNVAPTVLELMGLEQPAEMTCRSLIRRQ
ncbi:MAG: 2,3-bisphosphoglycerate-independent phosphoglycerate mutase [Chloroflexi bacterium]|nr:MAG: 2,3-bisphosphoglycerate-independent phosphoglycerate mutase [Chloroflexota bacterium]